MHILIGHGMALESWTWDAVLCSYGCGRSRATTSTLAMDAAAHVCAKLRDRPAHRPAWWRARCPGGMFGHVIFCSYGRDRPHARHAEPHDLPTVDGHSFSDLL
jgi:hypothetical protein